MVDNMNNYLLRKFDKERVVEVATDERTVCLDYDAVLLAVLHDRPLLTVRVQLYGEAR